MVGHPPGPGFIPLRFGDVLDDGTYVVVRKLSYSPLASVWLAKDLTFVRFRLRLRIYDSERVDFSAPQVRRGSLCRYQGIHDRSYQSFSARSQSRSDGLEEALADKLGLHPR